MTLRNFPRLGFSVVRFIFEAPVRSLTQAHSDAEQRTQQAVTSAGETDSSAFIFCPTRFRRSTSKRRPSLLRRRRPRGNPSTQAQMEHPYERVILGRADPRRSTRPAFRAGERWLERDSGPRTIYLLLWMHL